MREIDYSVRGFLTVHKDSLRVPLHGSLKVAFDPDSGLLSGDLALDEATSARTLLGATLVRADVRIIPESPVIGRIDADGRLMATATVDAVITAVHSAGRTLLTSGSCRTAAHATVPLRSRPGFSLDEGGRLAGRYYRPPFTGCGWLTPLVNLLIAGAGNAAVIDISPVRPGG